MFNDRAGEGRAITVVDVETGVPEVWLHKPPGSGAAPLDRFPDGDSLLLIETDSGTGPVEDRRRLSRVNAAGLRLWSVPAGRKQGFRLSPSGRWLAGDRLIFWFDRSGRRIFYAVPSEDPERAGLFGYDRESERVEKIAEIGFRNAWTLDGDRIAWVDRDHRELWLMRGDGTDRRMLARVPPGQYINDGLNFSPDGGWLAYARGHDLHRTMTDWEVWVAAVDGTENREIEAADDLNAWNVEWSRDGSKIALATSRGNAGLWMMESRGAVGPGE